MQLIKKVQVGNPFQISMIYQLQKSYEYSNVFLFQFPFNTFFFFFFCFRLHYSSERALLCTAHKTFNRQAVVQKQGVCENFSSMPFDLCLYTRIHISMSKSNVTVRISDAYAFLMLISDLALILIVRIDSIVCFFHFKTKSRIKRCKQGLQDHPRICCEKNLELRHTKTTE